MSSPIDGFAPPLVPETGAPPPASEHVPGVWKRTLLVFVRPVRAWDGLRERQRWWFPMLVLASIHSVCVLLTYARTVYPTIEEKFTALVEEGKVSAADISGQVAFWKGPMGAAFQAGAVWLVIPIILLLGALVLWFAVGFVLGRKTSFRLSLEIYAWASLVTIPEVITRYTVGWFQEMDIRKLHLGFGGLLGYSDPPTKLQTGLGGLLDGVGPFGAWFLVVLILATVAVSGAPRKNVAWVLTAVYLALVVLGAVVAAVVAKGA
jgi:hypothetical protein